MSQEPTSSEPRVPGRAQVVVVGAGIAGTSAAYHLASGGADTLLLEREEVGGGATRAAAGVLSPPMRQPFHETVRFRGLDTARNIWQLAFRSIDGLGDLLSSHGEAEAAELDLSGGHVLAQPHTSHEMEHAFRALEEAELDVEWLEAERVRELGVRGFSGGYRILTGGSLDPVGATRALAQIAVSEGLTLAEGVSLEAVRRTRQGLCCETSAGPVECEAVVHASHIDSQRFSPFLREEIVPIRGQGMATEPVAPRFPGCFATHWKLNVWRQRADGSLMISGWRHDAWNRAYRRSVPAVDDQLQGDLTDWFEAAFPEAAPLSVRDRWSGVFGWTADYLPLVGPLGDASPGEFVITGFSGGGLPFAFEAGRIVADSVAGGEARPGSDLVHPGRFSRFQLGGL